MLSASERERYQRQVIIEGFGESAQRKLGAARALVAGAGGLGSAIALYLSAAGIGALRFVDHGAVDLSNLNRQVLYTSDDIGRRKVDCLVPRLARLNPAVRIETSGRTIDGGSVLDLMHGFLDASRRGRHQRISSSCGRPEPLPTGLAEGRLDE